MPFYRKSPVDASTFTLLFLIVGGGEGRGGGGGQKSIKMYRHSLWMAPKITMFDPLILTELMKGKPLTLSNVFKVRFLLRHAW